MRLRTLLLAPAFFVIGMASYGIHFAARSVGRIYTGGGAGDIKRWECCTLLKFHLNYAFSRDCLVNPHMQQNIPLITLKLKILSFIIRQNFWEGLTNPLRFSVYASVWYTIWHNMMDTLMLIQWLKSEFWYQVCQSQFVCCCWFKGNLLIKIQRKLK